MLPGLFLVLLKALVKCLECCLLLQLEIFPSQMGSRRRISTAAACSDTHPSPSAGNCAGRAQKGHTTVVGRQTYPSALFVLVPCVGMCSLLAGDVLGRAGQAGCSQGCCHLGKNPCRATAPAAWEERGVILDRNLFSGPGHELVLYISGTSL